MEVPEWLTEVARNQFNPRSILSSLPTSERTSPIPSQVLPQPDTPLVSEQENTSDFEQASPKNIQEIPTPPLANLNPPKTEQSTHKNLLEVRKFREFKLKCKILAIGVKFVIAVY
jgi:hypothetical protein